MTFIASDDGDDVGRHGVLEWSYRLHDNQQSLISMDVLLLVGPIHLTSSLPGRGTMTSAAATGLLPTLLSH
jgi:hypothetical protein